MAKRQTFASDYKYDVSVPTMTRKEFQETCKTQRPPSSILSVALLACSQASRAFDLYPEDLDAIKACYEKLKVIEAQKVKNYAEIHAIVDTLKKHKLPVEDFDSPQMPQEALDLAYEEYLDSQIMKARELRQALAYS